MALTKLGMKLAKLIYGDRKKLNDLADSNFYNSIESFDSLRAPEVMRANRERIATISRVNAIMETLIDNDAPDSMFEDAEVEQTLRPGRVESR